MEEIELVAIDGLDAAEVEAAAPIEEPPPAPVVAPDTVVLAFERALRALALAYKPGLPLPSVRMYPDGAGEFIFPGKLAQALKGNAAELTKLIGSNRLSIASTVAEDPDAVAIRVPGATLGREED